MVRGVCGVVHTTLLPTTEKESETQRGTGVRIHCVQQLLQAYACLFGRLVAWLYNTQKHTERHKRKALRRSIVTIQAA